MELGALFHILLILIVLCSPVSFSQSHSTWKYSVSCDPLTILVDASLSSNNSVATVTNARSDIECLEKCQRVGCNAAVSMETKATCEIFSVALIPKTASRVVRIVGSQGGEMVWKADDRDWQVTAAQLKNSSSGRNGSIRSVLIATSGCYLIEAAGARGGGNTLTHKVGGQGAQVSARVNLTTGTQLSIAVGQMGGSTSVEFEGGGGGGGSFVYRTSNQLLLLAAGGGGGATYIDSGKPGEFGVNGSDSLGGHVSLAGIGGANGQPGSNDPSGTAPTSNHGGCGAGWLGGAVNPRRGSLDGERGGGLADGWVGGSAGGGSACDGGFGGGGGGGCMSGSLRGAPGAGGGFSGGGAGVGYGHIGGGGGSFCLGGCVTSSSWTGDQGFVSIRYLSASCD